jgi:hypothetical protein
MNSVINKKNLSAAYLILILLLIGGILLPFGIALDLGPGPNRLRALIWEYLDAPWYSGVRLVRAGQVLEGILYTLPTYFFIVQVFNLFRRGVKGRHLVLTGILSAIFPALISLVQVVGWVQGWTQPPPSISDHRFPIYIPLPTVPILVIVLIRLFPIGARDEQQSNSSLS